MDKQEVAKLAKEANKIALQALPPRFKVKEADWETYKKIEAGQSLLLMGNVGTGKTYKLLSILACDVVKELLRWHGFGTIELDRAKRLVKKRFLTVAEALKLIKDGFDNPRAVDMVESMKKVDILFLDDLGAEKASEWVKEQLYIVINHRYNWELPVVITTNLTLSGIAEHYGDRMASRLAEMCEVVKFEGKDKRLAKYTK